MHKWMTCIYAYLHTHIPTYICVNCIYFYIGALSGPKEMGSQSNGALRSCGYVIFKKWQSAIHSALRNHMGLWRQKMAASVCAVGKSFLLRCTSGESGKEHGLLPANHKAVWKHVDHDLIKNGGCWNKMVERRGVHRPCDWRVGGHFWAKWDKWLLCWRKMLCCWGWRKRLLLIPSGIWSLRCFCPKLGTRYLLLPTSN